jgi:ribosomal protein S12 methylthiotransferase accessory factor
MFDAIPFRNARIGNKPDSFSHRAITSFVEFLEKKLGVIVAYDRSRIPFGRDDLSTLFDIAETLRRNSIIATYDPPSQLPDEPRFHQWRVIGSKPRSHITGGMSVESTHAALISALAEAVERHLWFDTIDYFHTPTRATYTEIMRRGRAIDPERFAGYSQAQRDAQTKFSITTDSSFLWIRAHSWASDDTVWVPAQVVSGFHGSRCMRRVENEPILLASITNGLATGPTREFAILNGVLELIERDAFMITWLNQISPPVLDLDAIAATQETLSTLLERIRRYRLEAHVVHLPTDAPAYAVCAVIRDSSTIGPSIVLGLKAHRNLARAAEGALLEALRMRQNIRNQRIRTPLDPHKDPGTVEHTERALYWAEGDRHKRLAFLTAGKREALRAEPWENDAMEEHLIRIISWCNSHNYEFASVDLGCSKRNVSPWHVYLSVIPELQPMHQNEKYIYLGGKRLTSVPAQFGYVPRHKPFADEPHPFA